MTRKERVDKLYADLLSKRTWVFFISTIALFTGFVAGSEWTIIATIYLGEKVVTNFVVNRGGNSTTPITTVTPVSTPATLPTGMDASDLPEPEQHT